MASEMLSAQMVEEDLVIEEVLLAEIAPGVRQDLSLPVGAWVPVVDVISYHFDVVKALLPNEDQSTFQTDLAKGLLVLFLQVDFECFGRLELIMRIAAMDEALKLPHLGSCLVDLIILVVDLLVFFVLS